MTMAARKPASGNWNPDWESFARLDPAWTEKALAMTIAPAVSGALDASVTHMNTAGLRRHIRRALALGATRNEIVAVLQIVSLQGLETMCHAAPILVQELEAHRGKQKPQPKTTSSKDKKR
jgi:alkylhydroperoxidase/carboxymuconolactone decarboxylase family protein YurZ